MIDNFNSISLIGLCKCLKNKANQQQKQPNSINIAKRLTDKTD